MRCAVGILALAAFGSSTAYAQDRIGEICSGKETIQIGASPPKVAPYSLTFSADLVTGYYCYAECKPTQTYRIKDRTSDPIKLADLHDKGQTRVITFDRRQETLTDYQNMQVFGAFIRNAKATCRAATFREPTSLQGD